MEDDFLQKTTYKKGSLQTREYRGGVAGGAKREELKCLFQECLRSRNTRVSIIYTPYTIFDLYLL